MVHGLSFLWIKDSTNGGFSQGLGHCLRNSAVMVWSRLAENEMRYEEIDLCGPKGLMKQKQMFFMSSYSRIFHFLH